MVVESYVIIEKIIEDPVNRRWNLPQKIKKGKPCEKDLPLLKNDITRILRL